MNKVWIKVTHMFLLLTELSRSPISCLYFLWSEKTILVLVTKHYLYSKAEKCLIHHCGVNLLNGLWVFDLLPLLTICYLFLWRNRIHRKRLSSDHKVFSYSTTLTGDLKGYKTNRIMLKHSRRYLWVNPLPLKAVRFQLFSYREVDANGLILPMDFVSEIIEEAHNGGLLQRHGWAEARAHNSRPRQSNALPVVQVSQAHSAVVPQKAV